MRKLLLSLFFGISVLNTFAQIIPNGDFESTNTHWIGTNYKYDTILIVTNTKLFPVHGSHFLTLSNIDSINGEIHNQFASTYRPDTFSFHVGYFRLYASEAFGVEVLLSKWNSNIHVRDTICFLYKSFPSPTGQIIPWTVENISLISHYRNSAIPDTAKISFFNDVTKDSLSSTFMVLDQCKWGFQAPSNITFVGFSDYKQTLNKVYYSNGILYFNCPDIETEKNQLLLFTI